MTILRPTDEDRVQALGDVLADYRINRRRRGMHPLQAIAETRLLNACVFADLAAQGDEAAARYAMLRFTTATKLRDRYIHRQELRLEAEVTRILEDHR